MFNKMLNRLVKRTFKAVNTTTPLPKPPPFPLLDKCCQKNCRDCVWIDYFKRVSLYRKYVKAKNSN